MPEKFRCGFEIEIDVQFDNPEIAEERFCRVEWKTLFYALEDLEEVAETLATEFHQESDKWDWDENKVFRDIEGFGRFIRQEDGTYKADEASVADIGTMVTIRYEVELDHAWTHKM